MRRRGGRGENGARAALLLVGVPVRNDAIALIVLDVDDDLDRDFRRLVVGAQAEIEADDVRDDGRDVRREDGVVDRRAVLLVEGAVVERRAAESRVGAGRSKLTWMITE